MDSYLEEQSLGHKRKPLFSMIDFDHVIIDTLHLLLRGGGTLLDLAIGEIVERASWKEDCKGSKLIQLKPQSNKEDQEMKKEKIPVVVQQMKKIGVQFEFTQGKKGGISFKSLQGDQLKKTLKEFDLTQLFATERAGLIRQLWDGFLHLLEMIKRGNCHPQEISSKAKEWWELFCKKPTGGRYEIGRDGGLYSEQDATPYLHVLVEHSSDLVKMVGGLQPFSCDGLEKKGHLVQETFWRKTLKGGGKRKKEPIQSILELENRQLHWAIQEQDPINKKRKRNKLFKITKK